MIEEIIDRLIVIILLFFGISFLILSWWLPNHIEQLREHGEGGVSAYVIPGFASKGEAMISLITAFSILSTIAVALIVLPSSGTKSTISILLGVVTLIIFSIGVIWSLYLSLIRSLSATAPSQKKIYWSLRLLLIGIGFTMFTLASRFTNFDLFLQFF